MVNAVTIDNMCMVNASRKVFLRNGGNTANTGEQVGEGPTTDVLLLQEDGSYFTRV